MAKMAPKALASAHYVPKRSQKRIKFVRGRLYLMKLAMGNLLAEPPAVTRTADHVHTLSDQGSAAEANKTAKL